MRSRGGVRKIGRRYDDGKVPSWESDSFRLLGKPLYDGRMQVLWGVRYAMLFTYAKLLFMGLDSQRGYCRVGGVVVVSKLRTGIHIYDVWSRLWYLFAVKRGD